MGGSSSKQEKALLEFPEGERYFGFENFGNTCYANSVLQSLYFCRPFRENLLQYQAKLTNESDDNLLNCLAELFHEVLNRTLPIDSFILIKSSARLGRACTCNQCRIAAHEGRSCMQITTKKKKTGVIAPKKFVQRLKRDNELFRSYMHQVQSVATANKDSIRSGHGTNSTSMLLQDAHEFLYFLFNEISEVLEKSEKDKLGARENGTSAQTDSRQPKTWVHELFQGTMVNEMRCMQCETVTSREEAFYDLSLEIEHNSSVTSCLRNFR